MKTMPLPEIITTLVKINGCSETLASAFLNEFTQLVAEGLANDGSVTVKGIGTFQLIEHGDETEIEFAPDKVLSDAVNAPFAIFEPVELDDEITGDMLARAGAEIGDMEEPQQSEPGQSAEPEALPQPVAAEQQDEVVETHAEPIETQPQQPEPEEKDEEEPIAETVSEEANAETVSEEPITATVSEEPIAAPVAERPIEHGTNRTAAHTSAHEQRPIGLPPIPPLANITPQHTTTTDDSEERLRKSDRSRYRLALVFTALVSLIVGVALGYFAYHKVNLTGVKSVNISAEDVQVIHQHTTPPVATAPATADTTATATDSTTVEAEPQPTKPIEQAVVTDTIRSNRYLTTMALQHYGKKKFWVYIYEENKDKLNDPDLIPNNTVVVIPPASKYGIKAGDAASEADAEKRAVEIMSRYH
jgi:nucleoid DNA-binding protein